MYLAVPKNVKFSNEMEAVVVENPVKMGLIQITGVMITSSGLALTTSTSNTSVPTARNCADYVVSIRL